LADGKQTSLNFIGCLNGGPEGEKFEPIIRHPRGMEHHPQGFLNRFISITRVVADQKKKPNQ